MDNVKTSRQLAIKDISEELGRVIRRHLDECTKTCINCEHFSEADEICHLAKVRPPARIIAFGCERYDERIPF